MEMKTAGISKRVLMWTEGGSKIGMGHIMRSLPIADLLKEKGFDVSFAVNNEEAAIGAVTSAGYSTVPYECNSLSMEIAPDYAAIVFDSKSDISKHVRYFKDNGVKVVLIDDLSSSADAADCVIIPSLLKIENTGATPRNHILQGIQYFPLNQNFMQARGTGETSVCSRLRVLVTMGGSDPNSITTKIVKVLRKMEGIDLQVVVGPSMSVSKELVELIGAGNLIFHADVKKMALLMYDSDIAFTAYGITLYELAYMGVPAIVIANYREDKKDLEAYDKLGIGIPLGFHETINEADIRNAVESFLHNRGLLSEMSKTGRMLVDGNGAERIVKAIENIRDKDVCRSRQKDA